MFSIKYVYIYSVICVVVAVCDRNVVDTTHGRISGKTFTSLYKNQEYLGFIGIPYAAPPVQELRFLPPQPLEKWEDIREATKEKKPCAQFVHKIRKGSSYGFYGTENCLFLDIFTPAVDNSKRAVVMFIYNEQFLSSYNKTKDYQPDFFIEEDVVVVTISHRLSAFGFLSLEDETLWGNSGLKDVVQGLEWVRDNIDSFGGDRNKITLMGLRGGASIVDLLLHSKKKNLFRSAILHSGSAWNSAILQEELRERAFELANVLEKHPTTSLGLLKELNEIPAINITTKDLQASPKDYFKEKQRAVMSFGPIVEKDPEGLIVDYPENTSEVDTPVLIGFNSQEGWEGALHYVIEPRFVAFLKKDFPLLMPIRLNFTFDAFHDPMYDAIDEVKQFYFKGEVKIKNIYDFANYMGDVSTAYSTDYAAKTYARISKAPVYYYHFNYSCDFNENKNYFMEISSVDETVWGAAPGDEMCYLFKCPGLVETYQKHYEEKSIERILQMKFVRLWTNFIKYGNPTPEGDDVLEGLKWPVFTNENKQYLHINHPIEVKEDLNKLRFRFWDDFFVRWSLRAVNGVVGESKNIKEEL